MDKIISHGLVGLVSLAVGVLGALGIYSVVDTVSPREAELAAEVTQLEKQVNRQAEQLVAAESRPKGDVFEIPTISDQRYELLARLKNLGMEPDQSQAHVEGVEDEERGVFVQWFCPADHRIWSLRMVAWRKNWNTPGHGELINKCLVDVLRALDLKESEGRAAAEWLDGILAGPKVQTYRDFGDVRIVVDTINSLTTVSVDCYPATYAPHMWLQ